MRIGSHHTEEHKKKISELMKGKKSYWYGKKHTQETKDKIRLAHVGRDPWNKGLGTISSENEKARKTKQAKMWRVAVFERDNYTCQFCNERGGKLHADHIKRFADYPELRYELANGRTLCINCHKTTDTYGWVIYNRDKSTEELKSVIL